MFVCISITLLALSAIAARLVEIVYIGNKADKLARSITDKVARETELKIKRDFKRGIFD